eukprot:COSAG01_NODE_1134_length_11558_cov_8.381360_2_plen_123_part_00
MVMGVTNVCVYVRTRVRSCNRVWGGGGGGGGVTRGQARHGGQAYPAAAAESELAEAQRLLAGVRPGGDLAPVRALHASALALARAAIARPGAPPPWPAQLAPLAAPLSAVTKAWSPPPRGGG